MAHADYLDNLFIPSMLRMVSTELSNTIKLDQADGMKIDGIAVRGVSGIAIAGIVSANTDIPLVIVRKPDEKRHSSNDVEFPDCYYDHSYNYIIVDELISTGKTVTAIKNAIAESVSNRNIGTWNLVKMYFYDSGGSYLGNSAKEVIGSTKICLFDHMNGKFEYYRNDK